MWIVTSAGVGVGLAGGGDEEVAGRVPWLLDGGSTTLGDLRQTYAVSAAGVDAVVVAVYCTTGPGWRKSVVLTAM